RRRHTRSKRDWSSDVCSSDLCDYENGDENGCCDFSTCENERNELKCDHIIFMSIYAQACTVSNRWRYLLYCYSGEAHSSDSDTRSEERRVGKERGQWCTRGQA